MKAVEARLTAVDHGEALRYLGVRGEPPEDLKADLLRCDPALRAAVRPRAVWSLARLLPDGTLEGTAFRPEGEDIRALLSGCSHVILLAATLGAEAELFLRRSQQQAMADAVILDALASAALENICDNLCSDLAAEFAPRVLTPRFSPGYGDFPLAQPRELCAVLNVFRRIGVSLTPGGLMIPQKTVTALAGVSDSSPVGSDRGCKGCRLSDRCLYRKEGKTCGK